MIPFLPAILWLIISTILFCLPGSAFPQEKWFDQVGFDKWVHIGIFTTIMLLWCWAFSKKQGTKRKLRMRFIKVGITALFYGVGIEIIQKYFIPNRFFDIGDICADGAGILTGLFFSFRLFIKRETPVETGVVNQN